MKNRRRGRGTRGKSGGSSYGTLIAKLSANVTMAISETKTIHTLTPTNGRQTTYRVVWRAVPLVNDGSGGGAFFQESVIAIRKTGGTVSNIVTSNVIQQRNAPLGGASGDHQASGGNVLIRFTTSAGAAVLTRCDVYVDDAT